jgi:hypothetical protein
MDKPNVKELVDYFQEGPSFLDSRSSADYRDSHIHGGARASANFPCSE